MKDFFQKYPKAPCYYMVGENMFYAHQKDRAEMEARSTGKKLETINNPDESVKHTEGIGAAVVKNKSNEQLQKDLDNQANGITKKATTKKTAARKTTAKKTGTAAKTTNDKKD